MFRDYASLWRAPEKIVYSRALEKLSSGEDRIEREFDRYAILRLKQSRESQPR